MSWWRKYFVRKLKTFTYRPKLTFPLFLVIALLIPICALSAQSYWDAIFELGYEPITQKVNHGLACRRIEGLHRFRELISHNLTAGQDLLIKIRDLDSRITPFISHRLCRWELKRFYRYRVITDHWSKPERCRRLMNGVNQKNFGSFFTIRPVM